MNIGTDAPPTSIPHARLVLSDARLVRGRLEDETDERGWRLDWTLAIILLRTTGDVLYKVDGSDNPAVKAAAAELHRSWKIDDEHAIYRDFIKAERDSIVHEYRTSMTEGSVLVVALHEALSNDPDLETMGVLDENLFRPLEHGPFAGEDGRDVIDQAILWWQQQLDEIDRRVSASSGQAARQPN